MISHCFLLFLQKCWPIQNDCERRWCRLLDRYRHQEAAVFADVESAICPRIEECFRHTWFKYQFPVQCGALDGHSYHFLVCADVIELLAVAAPNWEIPASC